MLSIIDILINNINHNKSEQKENHIYLNIDNESYTYNISTPSEKEESTCIIIDILNNEE